MEKAIELNPHNAAALNYLGYTWAENGIRLEEAEALIRRALELSPNDGFYVDSLGWVYYQRGQYQQAIEQLERALELAGDDPTITEHLADAYRETAQPRKALGLYEQALRGAEGQEQEMRLRKKIDAMRSANREAGRDS
jgi:tetratricopeptide (TPR) repeat protein